MASIRPYHPDAAYGQPEVHIPYPAEPYTSYLDDDPDRESLMGEVKGDVTTAAEWAQPEEAFSNGVLEAIGIGTKLDHPISMEQPQDILLPIPRSAAEEKELHERAMTFLRERVAALEEEELFEGSMRNFTQRSSVVAEANGSMITAAGNASGISGESNAAGLGDQPRISDVRELLRADTRETWARERDRKARNP